MKAETPEQAPDTTWIYSCGFCDKEFKGKASERDRLWVDLEAHEATHRTITPDNGGEK